MAVYVRHSAALCVSADYRVSLNGARSSADVQVVTVHFFIIGSSTSGEQLHKASEGTGLEKRKTREGKLRKGGVDEQRNKWGGG